jgi:iron complex outermembrane recepter protein
MSNLLKAKKTTLAIAVASVSLLGGHSSISQAQVSEFALEEVVVTARKRSESLSDTPVAVVALSGSSMDDAGITNLEQVSGKVPGLQLGRAAQSTSVFIRGIGSGVNLAFEQSAGMYIDGVYQSRSRAFSQSMVDLQQVEVLKGPQGILFGKNTIAGAIKVETTNPVVGEEFGGSFAVDVEPELGLERGTLVLFGSPTDTLATRLAVRQQTSDGYIDNLQRDADEQEKDDSLVRLSVAWEPTDNLQVLTKYSRVTMDSEGKEVVNPVFDTSLLNDFLAGTSQLGPESVLGSIAALSFPGFQASSGGGSYDSYIGNTAYRPTDEEELNSEQFSLKVEWDVDDYTFTSLSAYTDFEFTQDHDIDFGPGNLIHADQEEENTLFSQEFRLASNYDGPFNFVAGLYYEEQDLTLASETFIDGTLGGVFSQLPASTFDPTAPAGLTLGDLGINSVFNGTLQAMLDPAAAPLAGLEVDSIVRNPFNEQESKTFAAFLETSYDFSEELTLELGLRYSEDSKEMKKTNSLGIGVPGNVDALIGIDGTPTASGATNPNTALVYASWASLSTFAHNETLERTEYHLDPSAKLIWHATEDTMVYLSYTEGYKSGGFNNSPDTAQAAPSGSAPFAGELLDSVSYESEEAKAWELGVKSELLDGRARVSATLFQTQIENLQVGSFQGTTFIVGNAAETTSRGIELDGELALTPEIRVGAAIAYLDSEYDSYEDAPCTISQIAATVGNCSQDLTGKTGVNAPEWSGSTYIDFNRDVGSGMEFKAHMDVNYKSEFYLDGDLDPNTLQDGIIKINARVALASIDETWEVALYARNLTDEVTHSFMSDSPLSAGLYLATTEEPRVLGLQGKYNF